MRAGIAAIALLFSCIVLAQFVPTSYDAPPAGDTCDSHTPSLHEKAVVSPCESKVSESEETATDCQLISQLDFSASIVPHNCGAKEHCSSRDLLRTLHRLQI